MPICTSCTHPTQYLYTVYQSAYNLRLEQCTSCHAFADPYVEHDSLTLLLDLILLKRDVYRHLLYNRGAEPRKADGSGDSEEKDRMSAAEKQKEKEKSRWLMVLRLGCALVLVDAFIRWTHLNPNQPIEVTPWTKETSQAFFRIFVGCLTETAAFHAGILISCYVILAFLDYYRERQRETPTPPSSIRQEFRFSLIPLTLLYSSLTKLFLLFLLSIWRPVSVSAVSDSFPTRTSSALSSQSTSSYVSGFVGNIVVKGALQVLDQDNLDREWIVRNVLGGMSAGFGLRVILDCPPALTTLIILAGWGVKTTVASFVSGWVGGDREISEAWMAYSIP